MNFDQLSAQASQVKNWLMPSEPGPLKKAYIKVAGRGQPIEVMFNPTELTLADKVVFKSRQGVQASRVEKEDFTVKLFFDTTFESDPDVRHLTDEIVNLTDFTTGTGVRKMPPTVEFWWDKSLFTGIVARVERTYTMFLPSGIPVRANLTVTLAHVPTDKELAADEGRPNCRRLWKVTPSDRLYLIAQTAYGDTNLWRLIADANGIRDVLTFPRQADIGTILAIPDVHGDTFETQRIATYV
jgi:hypothetical protein